LRLRQPSFSALFFLLRMSFFFARLSFNVQRFVAVAARLPSSS
jgi:hypothetical protein